MSYDPAAIAAFYDDYGEREWTRFADGRTPSVSLAVHRHYLERFVGAGDSVLEVGAGPGRFTIELVRLGAKVVVADISHVQLELNREKVAAAGAEHGVRNRVVADVTDLSRFGDAAFDAVVCYGGPLSYVLERAPDAVAELARIIRPGGHVLVSVMSLGGALQHYLEGVLEEAREHGPTFIEEVVRTGYLPPPSGHTAMHLFRWRELRDLLAPYGEIVAASACGLLGRFEPEEQDLRELPARLEIDLAAEPGAIDCGPHMLAVLRR